MSKTKFFGRRLLLAVTGIMVASAIVVVSCNQMEEHLPPAENTPKTLTISQGDAQTLTNYLNILRLGTIDLRSNSGVRSILSDELQHPYYNDRISYIYLKQYLQQRTGQNLVTLMINSLLHNGGTQSQASILPSIVESFQLNGKTYRPYINIPFSTSVNLNGQPFIGSSWPTPVQSFAVKNYSTGQTVNITASSESFAQHNPLWIVNLNVQYENEEGELEWDTYMPWRRCSCKPNDGNPTGDPDPGDPQDGSCDAKYNGKSCGRGGFGGGCPSGDCQMDAGMATDEMYHYQDLIYN